jgi:hypothetical protein
MGLAWGRHGVGMGLAWGWHGVGMGLAWEGWHGVRMAGADLSAIGAAGVGLNFAI